MPAIFFKPFPDNAKTYVSISRQKTKIKQILWIHPWQEK